MFSCQAHSPLVLLSKPRTRNHRQLLSQLPKELWAIRNSNNRLLYRTSRDIGGSIVKLACVDLPCT